ncbi:MAG: biotin/lipoyl-containing protein [Chloroflexota bacterium]
MSEANGTPRPLATSTYRVELGGQTVTVAVITRDDGLYVRLGDGPERPVEVALQRDDGEFGVLVDGQLVQGLVSPPREDGVTLMLDGHAIEARVLDERAARLAGAVASGRPRTSEQSIRAPMPGLVVAVSVEVGQAVTRGTTLVILSAMKMQNELSAPADATVKEILVQAGQTVDQQQVLIRLE